MPSKADGLRWVKAALPFLVALALSLYPRAYAAEDGLSQMQRAPGDADAARLAQAADQLPWRVDLREQAGMAALQAGDPSAAVRELSQVRALGGISLDGLVALGEAYAASGNQTAAVDAWQAATRLAAKDHSPAYLQLERIYRSSGDLANLEQVLRAHAQEAPQNPQALYQLGLAASIAHADQAADPLTRAAGLDPALTGKVHTIQAGLLLASQSQDASHRMVLIGRALGSADEWDLARMAFQKALDLNPANAEALAFRGEALYHLGQDGSADLRQAVHLAPDSILVQALQAMYWLRQGMPERALVFLHAAAAQEPGNPVWQAEIGEALAALGDLADAAKYYQAAANLTLSDATYWQLLGRFSLQYQYQVGELGLPAARQAILINPENADSLDLMGQVLTVLGDTTSAERFFERAIATEPENSELHLHLGMLNLQTGDSGAAQAQLLLASKLQPGSIAGQQAGRLLKQYYP